MVGKLLVTWFTIVMMLNWNGFVFCESESNKDGETSASGDNGRLGHAEDPKDDSSNIGGATNITGEGDTPIQVLPEAETQNGTMNSTGSSPLKRYEDETTFEDDLNYWDFYGMWGRYDSRNVTSSRFFVPDLLSSKDHIILLTEDSSGSYLLKEYPALTNITFTMTYITNCSSGDAVIKGETTKANGKAKEFFSLGEKDIRNFDSHWTTKQFEIKPQGAPFTVKLYFKRGEESGGCVLAVDIMTLRGWKVNQNSDDESFTTEIDLQNTFVPETTAPHPAVNTTLPPNIPETNSTGNVTTVVAPVVNATTIEPPVNVTDPPVVPDPQTTIKPTEDPKVNHTDPPKDPITTTTSTTQKPQPPDQSESVEQIASLASAMWDAFYVFLALFCACIIAIIVLIVRQNRTEEPLPPAVSNYSPRSSSYQLDKSRENPAYQTDTV